MDAYIRVSRVAKRKGPRFISPEIQRDAIRAWAAGANVDLLEIFEELDESGGNPDRPLLEQAVRRIEAGGSEGLVVWRVDRFGRSLAHGLHTIERIQAAGGAFHSAQDGVDMSTDAGRLVLRVLLSVAEYQFEGVRESWREARMRAVRRGIYTCYPTPRGYRKTRSGRLMPDPRSAPIITEAFQRRVAGETLPRICRFLEEQGVLTSLGNPGWNASTLRRVFLCRVYLGEVRFGPYVNAEAHPPLTDAATFEAAQRPRILRRHESLPYLLKGLLRCAGCRHALAPAVLLPPRESPGIKNPRIQYTCRKHHARGTCIAPASINARKIEPYVIEAMLTLLARRRGAPLTRLADAEAKAEVAAAGLARYRDNVRIATVIGDDAFVRGLAVRKERLREALLTVAEVRARVGIHDLPPVADVRAALPTMTTIERRRLIARVIDTVFVQKGSGRARERVIVCPAGTQPRLLPFGGDGGRVNHPVSPRRGWINPGQL